MYLVLWNVYSEVNISYLILSYGNFFCGQNVLVIGIKKLEGYITVINLVQTTIATTLKQIKIFKHC